MRKIIPPLLNRILELNDASAIAEGAMKNSSERQPLSEADRQSFHEIYQAHHRRVYNICLRMTQNTSETEDLTQEFFRTLYPYAGDVT